MDKMILDNIDWSKQYDFTLILTKKNKKPIAFLKEAYNRNLERNLDTLDKLSFSIPRYVEDYMSHEMIDNPNYDSVVEENMVLLKCGDMTNPIFESYFIIKRVTISTDTLSKEVECSSREVMLNKNTITLDGIERQLNKDQTNTSDGIFDILAQETTWKLGHIDESARIEHINGGTNNKYRWFDSLSKPWYSFLSEDVCSAFNVILKYDTVNKRVNVYDRDNYGKHTGIILNENNYAKSITKKSSSENIVTKLEVSGRDGVTFEDVNPLGTNYIVNYDYFRQNGQMSEELMAALDKYDVLLNQKNTEFQNIKAQVDDLNAQLITKNSEMTALNEQLVALRHIQSGYMSSNDNTHLPQATQDVNNKVIEIANKQSEINAINTQLDTLNDSLTNIANSINIRNAKVDNTLIFTSDLLEEMEDFTYTESWTSDFYENSLALYNAAKEVLKDWSIPPIEFELDLVDLFGCAETQNWWGKIELGDLVRIYSNRVKANVDIRIIGYTYNIDSNNLQIAFSNKNKKLDDARSIGSSIRKNVEASKVLNTKKFEWNKIKGTNNAVETFLNNALDTSKQRIVSQIGKNKINISENGIFCIDADDENRQIAMLSGLIAITEDGWQSCSTAIDSTGVYSNMLVGRILLGEELYISNVANNLILDKDGFTLKDSSYKTLISPQGVASTDNISFLDSVDQNNPLYMNFFIDDNVNVIDKVILKFSVLDFRSYSKGASSGGGSTTSSGGGSTSSSGGDHKHKMFEYTGTTVQSVSPFSLYFGSDGASFYANGALQDIYTAGSSGVHNHTTPNHTHDTPNHDHGIIPGIYTSPKTVGSMNIYIDGVLRTTVSSEKNLVDITAFVATKGWHDLCITSNTLNRFSASLYVKSYIGA